MHRALFAAWIALSGIASFVIALFALPESMTARLLAVAFWAVAIVPLSFALWFHYTRKVEQAYVAQALEAWQRSAPQAGQKMAQAIDAALFEEDTIALNSLLTVIESEPKCSEFISVARVWMNDDRERSHREETLEAARVAARNVRPELLQLRA